MHSIRIRFAAIVHCRSRLSIWRSAAGHAAILGYTELRASQRTIGRDFTPIDRIQDVEFERRYGNDITSGSPQLPSSEVNREATLSLRPHPLLQLQGGYGSLGPP